MPVTRLPEVLFDSDRIQSHVSSGKCTDGQAFYEADTDGIAFRTVCFRILLKHTDHLTFSVHDRTADGFLCRLHVQGIIKRLVADRVYFGDCTRLSFNRFLRGIGKEIDLLSRFSSLYCGIKRG